eukprot:gene2615-30938_t
MLQRAAQPHAWNDMRPELRKAKLFKSVLQTFERFKGGKKVQTDDGDGEDTGGDVSDDGSAYPISVAGSSFGGSMAGDFDPESSGGVKSNQGAGFLGLSRLRRAAAARVHGLAASLADSVANVPCQLIISFTRFEGRMVVWVAPPPSDRLWYSFAEAPKIDMVAKPVFANRVVSFNMILTRVSNVLKKVMLKALCRQLVFPACGDIKMSFLTGPMGAAKPTQPPTPAEETPLEPMVAKECPSSPRSRIGSMHGGLDSLNRHGSMRMGGDSLIRTNSLRSSRESLNRMGSLRKGAVDVQLEDELAGMVSEEPEGGPRDFKEGSRTLPPSPGRLSRRASNASQLDGATPPGVASIKGGLSRQGSAKLSPAVTPSAKIGNTKVSLTPAPSLTGPLEFQVSGGSTRILARVASHRHAVELDRLASSPVEVLLDRFHNPEAPMEALAAAGGSVAGGGGPAGSVSSNPLFDSGTTPALPNWPPPFTTATFDSDPRPLDLGGGGFRAAASVPLPAPPTGRGVLPSPKGATVQRPVSLDTSKYPGSIPLDLGTGGGLASVGKVQRPASLDKSTPPGSPSGVFVRQVSREESVTLVSDFRVPGESLDGVDSETVEPYIDSTVRPDSFELAVLHQGKSRPSSLGKAPSSVPAPTSAGTSALGKAPASSAAHTSAEASASKQTALGQAKKGAQPISSASSSLGNLPTLSQAKPNAGSSQNQAKPKLTDKDPTHDPPKGRSGFEAHRTSSISQLSSLLRRKDGSMKATPPAFMSVDVDEPNSEDVDDDADEVAVNKAMVQARMTEGRGGRRREQVLMGLIREYLVKKGLHATVEAFNHEQPKHAGSITKREALRKSLALERIAHKWKQSNPTAQTLPTTLELWVESQSAASDMKNNFFQPEPAKPVQRAPLRASSREAEEHPESESVPETYGGRSSGRSGSSRSVGAAPGAPTAGFGLDRDFGNPNPASVTRRVAAISLQCAAPEALIAGFGLDRDFGNPNPASVTRRVAAISLHFGAAPAPRPVPPPAGRSPQLAAPPQRPPPPQAPPSVRSRAPMGGAAPQGGGLVIEDCDEDLSFEDPLPMPAGGGLGRSAGARGAAPAPKGNSVSPDVTRSMNLLLWGTHGQPPPSWQQGFFFNSNKDLGYGLLQSQGGPCGVLAGVQAHVLANLHSPTGFSFNPGRSEQQARMGPQAFIVSPGQERGAGPMTYDQMSRSITSHSASSRDALGASVCSVLTSYMEPNGWGSIQGDMDEPSNSLMGMHGYCTQELVNMIISGYCTQGLVNMLYQVGNSLKSPDLPIWVVCSESHFTVLFSNDVKSLQGRLPFDLFYYDELANQEAPIRLSLKVDPRGGWTAKVGDSFGDRGKCEGQNIPPLECVIETRWPGVAVNWNGSEPIL